MLLGEESDMLIFEESSPSPEDPFNRLARGRVRGKFFFNAIRTDCETDRDKSSMSSESKGPKFGLENDRGFRALSRAA